MTSSEQVVCRILASCLLKRAQKTLGIHVENALRQRGGLLELLRQEPCDTVLKVCWVLSATTGDLVACLTAPENLQTFQVDESPSRVLNFVFDGPPDQDAPGFIEVETGEGRSVKVGDWSQRPDGNWQLQVTLKDLLT